MDLNERNLPRFERRVNMSISDDADAKKLGESHNLSVLFVIEAGWSINDVIDRLLTITTSPRVAFQNANRDKSHKPNVYVVPKAGTRSAVDPEAATLERAATDDAYLADLRAKLDAIERAKAAKNANIDLAE